MPSLAKAIVQMRRSGIREVMDLASTMRDVIHLELGEPSFDTPPHIVEAAHEAARQGYTRYTLNAGFRSLREKLVQKLERVNGLRVTPDCIVVTAGSLGALVDSIGAIVEPGDEVLVPDPGFPNYALTIGVMHGVARRYRLNPDNGFLPEIAAIESEIGPRTRAIVVNSPSNPTGSVTPRETVQAIVELARKHDLFVISDEVYEQIVFEGEHVSPALFDRDGRVIAVFSFSKTYAMTGWRLGYLVASPDVAPILVKMQEPTVSCASAISQKAGEAALDGPQDCVATMCAAYRRRRDLAVDLLTELGVPFSLPHGAFYLMVDVSRKGLDSYAFAKALLMETRVAVAPGETFGPTARNYVRLSLAPSEDTLAEGIKRLGQFLG